MKEEQKKDPVSLTNVVLTITYFLAMMFSASGTIVSVMLECLILSPLILFKGYDNYITLLERCAGMTCNMWARIMILCTFGWHLRVIRVPTSKVPSSSSTVLEGRLSKESGVRQRSSGKTELKDESSGDSLPGVPWSFLDFTNCGVASGRTVECDIIMSNHLTNSDPFIWRAAMFPWTTKFLYKKALQYVPFLGQCLVATGDVAVHFTSAKGGWGIKKGATAQMMERCLRCIARGCPMFVFPEGGRAGGEKMLPLRQGFFRLASENDLRIKPVAIWGAEKAWPHGSLWLNPAVIYLVVPDDSIDAKGKSTEDLSEETLDSILNLLSHCPGFDREKAKPLSLEEFRKESENQNANSKLL